jgi:hypothetical protein
VKKAVKNKSNAKNRWRCWASVPGPRNCVCGVQWDPKMGQRPKISKSVILWPVTPYILVFLFTYIFGGKRKRVACPSAVTSVLELKLYSRHLVFNKLLCMCEYFGLACLFGSEMFCNNNFWTILNWSKKWLLK